MYCFLCNENYIFLLRICLFVLYFLLIDKFDFFIFVVLIICGETEVEISWTKGVFNNVFI